MSDTPESILKKYWGYDNFRPDQRNIVASILAGKDTLALLPTGGGKSVCFQVPGMLLDGMTLVVSPLIALMKDQVDALLERNITAAYLNSGQTWREQKQIMENALQGHYRFLYIAPERLLSESFKEYLPNLDISSLVIDEAHCISMWGSDFRPAFRKIYEIRRLLPLKIPVAAFTASAPEWIQEDIISGLKLKNPEIHQGEFGRSNLIFQAVKTSNRLALLLQGLKNTNGCSIVFAPTRKSVQEVATWLQNEGISAHFYHGGLSNNERSKKQQDWMSNRVRVMVCTNAFGMGVDKPDVRYVFHIAPSATPEDYYQESGRAGRDGKRSFCVMFHDEMDWKRAHEQILLQHPTEAQIKRVYHAAMNTIGVSPGHGLHLTFPLNYVEAAKKYRIPVAEFFYSLRALEKLGWLELNEGIKTQSKFMFIADYTEVYDFKIRYAQYEPILDVLLRSFGGVFESYVSFNEEQIAKRLHKEQNEIVKMLNTLQKQELIDYNPQSVDPMLTLLEPRVMYPSINMDQLNELKERRLDSLENIKKYANNDKCRSAFWIHYFTQNKSEDCGSCDVCKKKYNSPDPKLIAHNIKDLIGKESIDFHDLTFKFPNENRQLYLEVLESLIDNEEILKTESNQLILPS